MSDNDWIEVGDWVEPHSRDLDPREVAKIEGDKLWLWLFTDKPAGPFPIDNYMITRKRIDSCRVCLHSSHEPGLCTIDTHPACDCNGEE